jgi:nucleosome binding factor SPN SPT16 subunit
MGSHQRVMSALSQAAAIAALIPGAPMSAAMEAAIKSLEESPDDAIKALASKLTKNVGFGTGLEFRDSTAVLNLKNQGEVKAGMVFNVMVGGADASSKHTAQTNSLAWKTSLPQMLPPLNSLLWWSCFQVGLSDLENPDAEDAKGKTYALCVADTVVVKPGEGANEVLTTAMSKSFKNIAYFFKDANDDAAPAPKPKTEGAAKVVENKLRSENEDDVARRVRALVSTDVSSQRV